ncbi:class I SAM-dependent methyltransferase [Umezawaea sp. Da 62-37]|uniref:SAM-dependent methyltransferase n=1 Tax=Umezawaea sp. Da 62-37 TaxID=3075927 RepID=UPI0028F6E559|nr:class I SAM-dependent methyltransferase [Umezawaea sp. Da 62-37]WNV87668.1 class I SAM-dependent methyltransferase [Umezawaea sp. Da 62-37]
MSLDTSMSNAFYDPEMYSLKIGYAPRFDRIYADELAAVPAGSTVLELGCGTGDVLLPLARGGARVIGVDSSADMLAHFERLLRDEPDEVSDRVTLIRETLPDVPSTGPVDAVILPNDIVSHLVDDAAVDRLFANIHSVLAPDGLLVLDIAEFDVVELGSIAAAPHGLTRPHGFFPYTGDRHLRVEEHVAYDRAASVLDSVMRYEVLEADATVGSVRYRKLRMHPRLAREITLSLRLAGFEVTAVEGIGHLLGKEPGGLEDVLIRARPAHPTSTDPHPGGI